MHRPSNHLLMALSSRMPILSNPVAAMHRDYPGCEIEYLHLGQPCPLEHRRERRLVGVPADRLGQVAVGDRKSTRLNSSHLGISYAVFCLKKKKKQK